ncbi:hypothetical protein AKJ55_00810 [candidate division MSBL1 archaeon SCGC-AAA382M17]|uniref:Uncharacterized protein n=1 Tax=candidate division MSBL1 archaeon SCGC-AAA382M17 TaxID=1698284 RepID=A0ABR5TJT2_9EURY|nr:hypothetical protein AKJ55_00810 [candidate division MSBL1 archaeon SCGC-AAA382M17]
MSRGASLSEFPNPSSKFQASNLESSGAPFLLEKSISRGGIPSLPYPSWNSNSKPRKSNNQIAKMRDVSDMIVKKYREELESTSEIPKLDKREEADGKKRPAKRVWEIISPPSQRIRPGSPDDVVLGDGMRIGFL